jgi:L-asparaginase II
MRMRLQAEVLVLRGDIAESRHRVQCVLADANGAARSATAHPERVTAFRSAAKPFQLLPFVERGHADALGCRPEELAIMAASHSGSRAHLALVRDLLSRIGLDASHLACGYHDPQDPESLEDIRRDPALRGPLYNNCSGKHTGMLAFCRAEGWPVAGYEQPAHPLQQLLRRTVAECCAIAPERVLTGIDGCSLPVFGMPLVNMAQGYARLAVAMARGGDTRELALQRIGLAMAAHPVVVEGEGRLATDLMRATAGRLLAKSGAEGLLLVAEPARGLGVAIKCEDGAMRALGPATVELLETLGMVRAAELQALSVHRRGVVTNAAGLEVGWLQAHVKAEVTGDVGA